jgi:sugar phosphate isomerase/epimerase
MKRSEFLKTAMEALAAVTVTNSFGNFLYEDYTAKIKKFGLQLWSVRDDMAKDAIGVIQKLGKAGYNFVESFGGEKGIFWGMEPKAFKQVLSDNGLHCRSSHCGEKGDAFKKVVDQAASIDMKYLVFPWEGPSKTIDDYKALAEEFNKHGELCKKAGIQFAFHNHDFTFTKKEGIFFQDVLMENTDADKVQFEMDMYWVVTAGQDPIEWMKKYPNRFTLCHIKDREKNAVGNDASCKLGTGAIDYKKILKYAQKNGMKQFVVEQEKWANSNPIDSAIYNATFMKGLKL